MRKNPVLLLVMASVVACLIGIATGWRVAPKGQGNEKEQQQANTTGITDSLYHVIDSLEIVIVAKTQPVVIITEEEKEAKDVEYLNSNNVWEKAKLQSKKYQEFYEYALNNGKTLKNIDWESYNNITNDNWKKIYNHIKHYIESGDKHEWNGLNYITKVKNVAVTGRIDLTKVFETASHSAGTPDGTVTMPQ